MARADEFRQNRREMWRSVRARLLDQADRPMLRGYTEAALWARAFQVKITRGPIRVAQGQPFFTTRSSGDDRIHAHTAGIVDPETRRPFAYRDGLFLTTRPGLPLAPAGDGLRHRGRHALIAAAENRTSRPRRWATGRSSPGCPRPDRPGIAASR